MVCNLANYIHCIGSDNTVWIYVFNSYEYVQQDGSGVNNYHTDIDGDLENGTKN